MKLRDAEEEVDTDTEGIDICLLINIIYEKQHERKDAACIALVFRSY